MGALDDLIARDEANMRKGAGQMSELDALLLADEARGLPSNDPEIPVEEAPSFIGYDPSTAPPPKTEADPWEGVRSFASQLFDGPAQKEAAWHEARMNARGIHPENALAPADLYMGLMSGPLAAGKNAGLATRAATSIGNRLIEGGVQGAVSGARDAEDLGDAAREVMDQAGTGAGVSAALGAAGGVGGAVGRGAGKLADKWRNVVAGGTAADAKAAAKVYGLDAIDDPGRMLEKYSPSPALGMDSLGHARVVEGKLKESGGRLGDMVSEAEEMGLGQGAPAVDSAVAQKMLAEADGMLARARTQEEVAEATAFRRSAELIAKAEPAQGLRDVIENKSNLQARGHVGKAGTVPEAQASAQANAAAGSFTRDELHSIMQGSPRYDDYQAENQQYSELATLLKSLKDKAGGEQSGGAPAIIASALAGGGIGAIGGVATGQDPLETAMLAGGGAALTGTNAGIRQTLGTRGADMDANMMRALQGLGGTAERALPAMRGPVSDAADRRSERQTEKPGAQIAVGQTRLAQVLKTNPAALGDFASLLSDVANDPRALEQRAKNLAAREPMFRRLLNELDESSDTQSRPRGGISFSMEGE
jgi:hypothetical protein